MEALNKHSWKLTFALLLYGLFCLVACDTDDGGPSPCPDNTICLTADMSESSIRQELSVAMADNVTIRFGAGTYAFTDQLIFQAFRNVEFAGAGATTTILEFGGQLTGTQGLGFFNFEDLRIRDLTVSNARGDAIRVQDSRCITISRVRAVWDEPLPTNGGYGLYPVLSEDVLVEDSYVYGASDAGIYLGQSSNAIIRNNDVEGNVAGIEIENSRDVDVHGNTATDNTGGILVFDLPDITDIQGERIRVYDNVVRDNNRTNFAQGGIVMEVPAGTGVMILAVRNVEIFDNVIENNEIVSVAVFSFASVCALLNIDCGQDPFFNNIYVANNTINKEGTPNDEQPLMGSFFLTSFPPGQIPAIITDGIFDLLNPVEFCLQIGSVSFIDLNMGGLPPVPSPDSSPFDCTTANAVGPVSISCP